MVSFIFYLVLFLCEKNSSTRCICIRVCLFFLNSNRGCNSRDYQRGFFCHDEEFGVNHIIGESRFWCVGCRLGRRPSVVGCRLSPALATFFFWRRQPKFIGASLTPNNKNKKTILSFLHNS